MKRAFQLAFLLLLPLAASGSREVAATEDPGADGLFRSVAAWSQMLPDLLNPAPLRLADEQAQPPAPDFIPFRHRMRAPPPAEPRDELDAPFSGPEAGKQLIEEKGSRSWIGIQITAARSI